MVAAEETGELRFVFAVTITSIQYTEIAHLDHVRDELAATLGVRLAEEVFVLEAEVELDGHH